MSSSQEVRQETVNLPTEGSNPSSTANFSVGECIFCYSEDEPHNEWCPNNPETTKDVESPKDVPHLGGKYVTYNGLQHFEGPVVEEISYLPMHLLTNEYVDRVARAAGLRNQQTFKYTVPRRTTYDIVSDSIDSALNPPSIFRCIKKFVLGLLHAS